MEFSLAVVSDAQVSVKTPPPELLSHLIERFFGLNDPSLFSSEFYEKCIRFKNIKLFFLMNLVEKKTVCVSNSHASETT